jgi:RNase P/RNase MRP subunit POP5
MLENLISTAKRNSEKGFSSLTVKCEPPLDHRELETILRTCLQALFGEWEAHSCAVTVARGEDPNDRSVCRVHCPSTSVGSVRCALSMITAPAYLDSTIYRFDVVQVAGCTGT